MPEVWSTIMVQEVIHNMAEFAARECEPWDDNEDWDYTTENPEITDAEMEQIAPGTIQQVTKTVARHILSDQMYLAIYAEARELAQTAVNEMDPEDVAELVNTARKKVHRRRATKTWQNSSIPPGRRSTGPGPGRRSTRPRPRKRTSKE